MSGTTETKQHGPGGFEETVKDFWASRPQRPRSGRKLAGVAAAVGNRYGIDPVVVRVALVAATVLGGIGLVLYLLGWLFFPGEQDEVSAFEGMINRGRSSTSTGFTVVLCVALIPVTSCTFAGGWFDGGGVIGLALLAAALYLLHRSRGQFNRPVAPAPRQHFSTGAFSMQDTTTSAPSAWDPLGAAPSAWDLPDPAPAPSPPPSPPAPRRRSKIGPATFGVALLVAGVGTAIGRDGAPWFSPQHIIGLTLGVLGIGMVAGAFVRGGRGLIALAIPLSIAGMILTAVPIADFRGGLGDLKATPTTAAELKTSYDRTAGDIEIDLTKLPADVQVDTKVNNGAGDTQVLVPATADVTYTCDTRAGDVECLGKESNGVGNEPVTGLDVGTDGPGGQRITLNVTNGLGNVEVLRG